MATHIDPDDQMLEPEDHAFVRSALVGVIVGVLVMAGMLVAVAALVTNDAGWAFWVGTAIYAGVVTGGFFGGVTFATAHLMKIDRAEAKARAGTVQYVKAA